MADRLDVRRGRVAMPPENGRVAGLDSLSDECGSENEGTEVPNDSATLESWLGNGTIIGDRYRIVGELGRGGMGEVYLADHLRLSRRVALKVLAPEWSDSEDARLQFAAECKVVNRIRHPNVIEVLDAGELDDGRPFLVMEYLDGLLLSREIDRVGRFELARACRLGRDLAQAVAAAHRAGIVHCDLKSQNVMLVNVAGEERVVLLDFGIAAELLDSMKNKRVVIAGTPEYMAPEQGIGMAATTAFDVYAFGVLMFEMLTGSPPFVSKLPFDVLTAKARNPAPSLSEHRRELPPKLVELVDSCLEIDPHARPASLRKIAKQLATICNELERGVTESAVAPPVRSPWRLRGVAILPVAVAALMLLAKRGEPETPRLAAALSASSASVDVVNPQENAAFDAIQAETSAVWDDPRSVSDDASDAMVAKQPDAIFADDVTAGEGIAETSTERPFDAKPETTVRRAASLPKSDIEHERKAPPKRTSGDANVREEERHSARLMICDSVRRKASDARELHDWRSLLEHLREKECWSGSNEREKLLVKAYAELGRFDECVRVGHFAQDSFVRRVVSLCERRMQRGEKNAASFDPDHRHLVIGHNTTSM